MSDEGGKALLVVLTLAIGALSTATAQAEIAFKAPGGYFLEGERRGEDRLPAAGVEKDCEEASFKGNIVDGARFIEVEPRYNNCVARMLTGLKAKYVWGGCLYRLRDLERAGAGESWKARVDLVCPSVFGLEWNIYETEERYSTGSPICVTWAPSQTGIGTATLRNLGGSPGKIAIHWDLDEIEYQVTGSGLVCGSTPVGGKALESYEGETVLAAKNAAEKFVDLSISG